MRCWQHQGRWYVRTPAKLNLFLDIHGRRPDGYHELETLMVQIGIYDTLCFEEEDSDESHLRLIDVGRRSNGTTHRSDGVPVGPENLILQAVRALQKLTGIDRQVRITLRKQIPVSSGLAGGSSDAAATLVGLNHCWNLGLNRAALFDIGTRLGSDVNFFLAGTSAAVCRGRGELIEPVAIRPGLPFVVVRPRTGLATAEVYRHCRVSSDARTAEPLVQALRRGRIRATAARMHNALQQPAERLSSDISALRHRFEDLPVAGHQMTGSGTAYFGFCRHQRLARRLAQKLQQERLGEVFATRSVS